MAKIKDNMNLKQHDMNQALKSNVSFQELLTLKETLKKSFDELKHKYGVLESNKI